MAVWTRRREDVGGVTLAVRALGSEGPPLVLLHGLGVSGQVWQGFGRLLEPSVRLIAPDLRGHGESDKPSAGYLPRQHVVQVERLRHDGPGALERELMRREPGMGDLYARALATLYRTAADGAFQAVLRAEPGFPSVVASLGNVQGET